MGQCSYLYNPFLVCYLFHSFLPPSFSFTTFFRPSLPLHSSFNYYSKHNIILPDCLPSIPLFSLLSFNLLPACMACPVLPAYLATCTLLSPAAYLPGLPAFLACLPCLPALSAYPACLPAINDLPAIAAKRTLPVVDRSKADLPAADRSKADLPVVDRSKADLLAVDRSKADLPAVDRSKADLPAVDRSKADLPGIEAKQISCTKQAGGAQVAKQLLYILEDVLSRSSRACRQDMTSCRLPEYHAPELQYCLLHPCYTHATPKCHTFGCVITRKLTPARFGVGFRIITYQNCSWVVEVGRAEWVEQIWTARQAPGQAAMS